MYCQNNLVQHGNILNGKYIKFNIKCMGKTFNKHNELISVQFNTIFKTTNTCNNNNNINYNHNSNNGHYLIRIN